MRVTCFSSFSLGYLDRARVMFSSLRRHQPDWNLVALVTDVPPPNFSFTDDEPFDSLVYSENLDVPNVRSWLFKHDIVEACTAVKGPFADHLCRAGEADAVVYLDPDTCAFGSLAPVERLLDEFDIVLTPHTVVPETQHQAIIDNEMCSLRTGTFNLGFCAFRTRGAGSRFARWWSERLLSHCYDDIPTGLFVDQRWCDLVPALFDKVHILRDPGYNVASWNLSNRNVEIGTDGAIRVNGAPLRFWHFTKLGPTADIMTKRYAGYNFPVYEIWNWYRRRVSEMSVPSIPQGYWGYGTYSNGVPVAKEHRLLYRREKHLQDLFADPFQAGAGSFLEWIADRGVAYDDTSTRS